MNTLKKLQARITTLHVQSIEGEFAHTLLVLMQNSLHELSIDNPSFVDFVSLFTRAC